MTMNSLSFPLSENIFILSVFFFKKVMYFCLLWVSIIAHRLPLVVAGGAYSSLQCVGFLLWGFLLLHSAEHRHWGTWASVVAPLRPWSSVVVAHGLTCPAACGIFLDQGSNPCLLYCQADSQPLDHQGNPSPIFLKDIFTRCRFL